MAERRMFAKTIIDSDAFVDMPTSAQALYFHLAMRADDEGFINNPKKIQIMVGCNEDDLRLLGVKKFIIPFETGIVVIKHWKIHNYIRGDRKKETVYVEEMNMLDTKDNGAYTLKSNIPALPISGEEIKETARQKAYKESSLPYSFEYKIKAAFYGEKCPVCGFAMESTVDECGIGTNNRIPTIQHNLPISKGGKHELGNISIICKHCNITLQDTETGELNAGLVIKKWDEILMSDKCQTDVSQMSVKCQHRLGKDRLGKDNNNIPPPPPKLEKEHINGAEFVTMTNDEYEKLIATYGKEFTDKCVEVLDNYKGSSGKKYKSDYRAVLSWVVGKVNETKQKEKKTNAYVNETQSEYNDLDRFYN